MRRRVLLSGTVALSGVALVLVGVAVLASRQTPTPVARQYSPLLEARAVRHDIRGAPTAVSVLTFASSPTPAPVPQIYASPVERILVPRVGIDAQLVALNLNADGAMDVPNAPELVAWYDFTAKPGLGGNAVFSGHVDWRNYGPAVFWRLKELVPGDVVRVRLRDGTLISYGVTATASYLVADLRMEEILAPTALESVTLITCGGTFSAGEYSHRVVVRAVLTGAGR